ERTLARAFAAGTVVPFGRWRTLLRLQAALSMLAAGEPVSRVAGRVGYDTPSAFVAAFRRETGQTPGGFFRDWAFRPWARSAVRRPPACPRTVPPSGSPPGPRAPPGPRRAAGRAVPDPTRWRAAARRTSCMRAPGRPGCRW